MNNLKRIIILSLLLIVIIINSDENKDESGLKRVFVAKLFVVKIFLILASTSSAYHINNELTAVKKFPPPRF